MCLFDNKKILMFGGGVMAERFYNQIPQVKTMLAGVFDILPDEKRKIKEFHKIKIENAERIRSKLTDDNYVILVAIGAIDVFKYVRNLVDIYKIDEDRVYVANPYSTLRFFCIDDDFAKDTKIPYNDERYSRLREMFDDSESLKLFDFLVSAKEYNSKKDTYELVKLSDISDLYYYSEDYWNTYSFTGEKKTEEATVIDCGAYIGDSVIKIVESIPENRVRYYAIEPLEDNAKKMENTEDFNRICEEFTVFQYGVGEQNETLFFHIPQDGNMEGGHFNSEPNGAKSELKVMRIDDIPVECNGALYIKMDVEGSELGALKGAKETIKRYHPFLAICLYHRKNDLVEIPLYINSLGLAYDYYLRGGYHTILWAIPK